MSSNGSIGKCLDEMICLSMVTMGTSVGTKMDSSL